MRNAKPEEELVYMVTLLLIVRPVREYGVVEPEMYSIVIVSYLMNANTLLAPTIVIVHTIPTPFQRFLIPENRLLLILQFQAILLAGSRPIFQQILQKLRPILARELQEKVVVGILKIT